MEDMKDHIQSIQEQVVTMLQWSKSLNDDYLNEQQYRMNQVKKCAGCFIVNFF